MTFKSILARTSRPTEEMILLHRESTTDLDEIGFAKEEWIELQKIHGVIQQTQALDIAEKGMESNPVYVGYFLPEFELEFRKMADYRVQYKKPYEIVILKINDYNPNLFLRHSQDHIQMTLEVEKKI